LEKQRGVNTDLVVGSGTGETMIGASAKGDASAGRVALDLQLIDYQTQTMISGVQTTNSINIFKTSSNKDFNIAIYGNGLGINGSFTEKQGLHAAIRLLVETSILELVGEFMNVPYWRCVEGANPDDRMISRFREQLVENPETTNIQMKVWAFAHGHPIDLDNITLNDEEKALFEKLKAQYQVSNDYDLAIQLWLNVPISEGAKRIKDYRRAYYARLQVEAEKAETAAANTETTTTETSTETAAEATAAGASATDQAAPKVLNINFGKITDEDW
jgi:hypothetical protein